MEYGTYALGKLINKLVDSYSLPKRVSSDYDTIFIETRLIDNLKCFSHMRGRPLVSLNQVIPHLSKLDSSDKERLVSIRGLPDVLYRMFVAEKTNMIGFSALLAVNLKKNEWRRIYDHIKDFSEDNDYVRYEFLAFSASLSCPVSILNELNDAIEMAQPTDCPSGKKYYWSYVVKAKDKLSANLKDRCETQDADVAPPPSSAALISELRENQLSETQLHEYAYLYIDVDRLIAKSPMASQRTLSLLAKSSDKKTRRHVAENIQTSHVDWINLGGEFPTIFEDGPNLTVRLLETPDILHSLPGEVCRLLAASHNTPKALLHKLSKYQHPEIAAQAKRQLTATHEQSGAVIDADMKASQVTATSRSPLEIDTLFEEKVKYRLGTRIYDMYDKGGARHAWEKKYIGPEQFAHLHVSSKLDIAFNSECEHYEVCSVLFLYGRIDSSRSNRMLQMLMAGNSGRYLERVLSSDKIGSSELHHLIKVMLEQEVYYDSSPSALYAIAENENTSSDQLDRLAYSKAEKVRHRVACNPNTALATLSILENEGGVIGKAAVTNRQRRKSPKGLARVKQSHVNIDNDFLFELQNKVKLLKSIICDGDAESASEVSMNNSLLSESQIMELKQLYSEHKNFLDKLGPLLRNGEGHWDVTFIKSFLSEKDCPELIMAFVCTIKSTFCCHRSWHLGRLSDVLICVVGNRNVSAAVHAFLG